MDYFNLTENELNRLSPVPRLEQMTNLIQHSDDESQRWDCICLCGELYHKLNNGGYRLSKYKIKTMKSEIVSLFKWVLKNEKNGVVLHEVCYHIAARNIRSLIPDLVYCGINSDSMLCRHEALESLGLMNAKEVMNQIGPALNDPIKDVRETAQFVLKRINRYKKEVYEGLQVV